MILCQEHGKSRGCQNTDAFLRIIPFVPVFSASFSSDVTILRFIEKLGELILTSASMSLMVVPSSSLVQGFGVKLTGRVLTCAREESSTSLDSITQRQKIHITQRQKNPFKMKAITQKQTQ